MSASEYPYVLAGDMYRPADQPYITVKPYLMAFGMGQGHVTAEPNMALRFRSSEAANNFAKATGCPMSPERIA